jgi:dihydropteroate synthase
MEYHEAVNFLFDLRRFQVKPGTESVRDLLSELGDPHEGIEFVQIAGSNGKGSTARMVESVLRESGRRTGLFTSPHFDDVRERVRVDGRKIPESALTEFVAEARPWLVDRAAVGEPLTFFETMTALALWYFDRAEVDVAVLEVGMGGKLDATSVVDPVAAAVTNVSLEHTAVLGDTIEEIARKKAAVAPAGNPLVTAAAGEALAALRASADDVLTVDEADDSESHAEADDSESDIEAAEDGESHAEADDSESDIEAAEDGESDAEGIDVGGDAGADPALADGNPDVAVAYGGRVNHTESAVSIAGPGWAVETRVPLLGAFQARNAGVAAVLARQVVDGGAGSGASGRSDAPGHSGASAAADLDDATIARGLRKAHWPGRFEVMEREPTVVLDGAHNPAACDELADVLAEFEYDDLHLVFGAMHDKDARGMAAALPAPASVVACEPVIDRAEDPEVLARVFEDADAGDVRVEGAVASALAAARDRADADDCVLVTGSLFTVAEARTTWTRATIPTTVDDLDDAAATLERAHVTDAGRREAGGSIAHRVVKTRVQFRQARLLREEMLAAGGECALSGQQREGDLLDVVLAGTSAQFETLVRALRERPYALPELAGEIREALGTGFGGQPGIAGGVERESRPAAGGERESRPSARDESGCQSPSGDEDGCGSLRHGYPWEDRAAVMGILNVTPDSFHDGGEYAAVEDAIDRAGEMVEAGVDVVDVGGESTRPGADPVPVEEERARVVPVIEAIADLDALVSIDTRKAEVARAALDAGADVLNDVTGLEDPEMRFLAAERDVPIVVMHSIDAPVVPGKTVAYDDVVEDVIEELEERVLLAEKAGVPREKIIVDPGLGFGKSRAENFELLRRLDEFRALGCPVLVGHSHKSMFEAVGRGAGERAAATIAGSALAVARGADIVRVHDVAENVDAVRVARAVDGPSSFVE